MAKRQRTGVDGKIGFWEERDFIHFIKYAGLYLSFNISYTKKRFLAGYFCRYKMRKIMNYFEPGQEIETAVVAITDDTIFLDLNLKTEGILDKAELVDQNGNVKVKEGDKIKAFYISTKDGVPYFTTRISGQNADADMLKTAFESQIQVQGKVEKEIKGGFEVKIGNARAFCPYSQMGFKQREEPAFYIGRVLSFIIQEFKENGKNIIVSNRAVMEAEHQENLKGMSAKYKTGDIVTGKVIELKEKGAIVDIGGVQAFLPISEICRGHVKNVSDKLANGQEVKAKIIRTDWEHERISISTKELEEDPWDSAETKYPENTKIDGTIARIADFGLFVTLEDGIDGLVHISELDVNSNTNLKKKFNTGDKISVVVKSVDSKNKRISLTTSTSKEQDLTAEKYMSSQSDDGDTYNPFAALLKK